MLSKEELKALGEEGFVAAPGESEEVFVKRVDILKEVAKNPGRLLSGKIFETWEGDVSHVLRANPKWIPLIYSNHKLPLWQGAVLWIFGEKGKEQFPIIQMRKGFRKGKILFYSQKEVLNHELLHAIRMGFDEPRFEEILAYSHSSSKIRRFFGPLFRTPNQAIVFLVLILLSIALQTTALFFTTSPLLPWIKGLSLLPFLDLAFRSASLIRDQRILKKALKKLSEIFPNQQDVFPIAVRLKDAEIELFALSSVGQILNEIEEKVPVSLRWRQILAQFC
ncbi:MAG: hypothetical protein H7A38_01065 [Chlamydiales bacterium]|nr:hypothetical protein [Chlamydiales bacterium]